MKKTRFLVAVSAAVFAMSASVSAAETSETQAAMQEKDVFTTQTQPASEQVVTKADILQRASQGLEQVQAFVTTFGQCSDEKSDANTRKAYATVAKALQQAQKEGTVDQLPASYKQLYQALGYHQQLVLSVQNTAKKLAGVLANLENGDVAYTDQQLATISNNVNVMLDMMTARAAQLASCQSLNTVYDRADAVNNS